jgi:tetratricopeptide (TPR) repeat protein
MLFLKLPSSFLLVLICVLASLCLAHDLSRPQHTAPSVTEEEDAVKALISQYYSAYAKKDLEGLMRFWSAKSPEAESRKKSLQATLADCGEVHVNGLIVRGLIVAGKEARARVEVDISAVDAKTGKALTGFGKMHRAFRFVKDGDAWRISHEAAGEEDLAADVAAAKTEAEREALLTPERDLTTPALVLALSAEAKSLTSKGEHSRALAIDQVALRVAKQIGDERGSATVLRNIGVDYYNQANYDSAIESFQKSVALSERLGDKAAVFRGSITIGDMCQAQNRYDLALDYYQRSLALGESAGDRVESARILYNVGEVYRLQGNYGLALHYNYRCLDLCKILGFAPGIYRSLHAIGIINFGQQNYELALEYLKKSLAMLETKDDRRRTN